MILRNTSRLDSSDDPSMMASHLMILGPVSGTGFYLLFVETVVWARYPFHTSL